MTKMCKRQKDPVSRIRVGTAAGGGMFEGKSTDER